MRIYLIGYMCSGKSTIGKQLAKKLGLSFYDTDSLFHEKYKISIPDFFSKYSEELFREKEREILQTTFAFENAVIATGGGTPCFYDNMEQMNKNGLTVFLQVSPHTVLHRYQLSNKNRPLLDNIAAEERLQFIYTQHEERGKYYEQAHIKHRAESIDITILIEKIKSELSV